MPSDIIDYSNTVFYKIFCNDATVNDIYVGHTTNFVQRKSAHKSGCIKANYPNHHLKVYKFIRANGGWDNWKMDMIGFHNCTDLYEARKIEQNYFKTLHATLNSIEPKPKTRPTTVPKAKEEKRVWHCDVCKTTCQTNKAFITHEETKKHKHNVVTNTSDNNGEQIATTNIKCFNCEKCNFSCSVKCNYNRHLTTNKHLMMTNDAENTPKTIKSYHCDCGKKYKYRQGLHTHKMNCNDTRNNYENTNDRNQVFQLIEKNNELIHLVKQQLVTIKQELQQY